MGIISGINKETRIDWFKNILELKTLNTQRMM